MSLPKALGVCVVGSANLDLVVRVDRLPLVGETVLGRDLVEVPGGKGLNQAVAAARVARSALVACVGDDDAGQALLRRLESAGVDTTGVDTEGAASGRAFVHVDARGENSIVVAPLANLSLTPGHVREALDRLRPKVVLAQLEIPLEAVLAAKEWAHDHEARLVLNPSPYQPLPEVLLEACDPLVANVAEAAQLLGIVGMSDVGALADALLPRATSVVVTDGPRGAHIGSVEGLHHVPGTRVDVADTTGAGDEFAGCLAGHLAREATLLDAVRSANLAAARVVARSRDQR